MNFSAELTRRGKLVLSRSTLIPRWTTLFLKSKILLISSQSILFRHVRSQNSNLVMLRHIARIFISLNAVNKRSSALSGIGICWLNKCLNMLSHAIARLRMQPLLSPISSLCCESYRNSIHIGGNLLSVTACWIEFHSAVFNTCGSCATIRTGPDQKRCRLCFSIKCVLHPDLWSPTSGWPILHHPAFQRTILIQYSNALFANSS